MFIRTYSLHHSPITHKSNSSKRSCHKASSSVRMDIIILYSKPWWKSDNKEDRGTHFRSASITDGGHEAIYREGLGKGDGLLPWCELRLAQDSLLLFTANSLITGQIWGDGCSKESNLENGCLPSRRWRIECEDDSAFCSSLNPFFVLAWGDQRLERAFSGIVFGLWEKAHWNIGARNNRNINNDFFKDTIRRKNHFRLITHF